MVCDTKFLTVGSVDVENFPANASFITDAIEWQQDYMWSLHTHFTNRVGGAPTLTIEASNDGVNWFPYDNQATNVDLVPLEGEIIYDDDYPPRFFRVNYDHAGVTSGEITMILTLKTDR